MSEKFGTRSACQLYRFPDRSHEDLWRPQGDQAMAKLSGKILFTSGNSGDTDLWRLDLASGELKQLTFGNWRNAKGRWSPDGQRIVYVSSKLGPSDLWVMDAGGKNEQRLTSDNRWYDHPDWSPDGTRIVCCSNRDGV